MMAIGYQHPELVHLHADAASCSPILRHKESAIRESFDNLDARAMVTLRNRLAGMSSDYHSCEAPRCGMPVADA